MLKFLKNRIQPKEQLNKEESTSGTATTQMQQMRKRVGMQAGLALLTVTLTVILIFAMTAAWYTNVVQTSGLIFQVEQWGVDVNAIITSAHIQAAPGDEGVIDFKVSNTGTDTVNVAVSVTKNAMDPVMQRRLYFYVDTQMDQNQELVQRVYLNSQTGYDYLLFGGCDLTLGEAYHNGAPLKWHWVYDVLGYYVRREADGQGQLQIAEYLRPIEYAYEQATYDAVTGELLTVNGVLTAQDFLTQLSENDGYAGTIDTTAPPADGYYPVAVDATTGSGVYAYLLNYNQIQTEMATDTAMGNAEDPENLPTYVANFTIYAENYPVEAVAVATQEALVSALATGTNPLIQLTQDITLTEEIVISNGSSMVLDLNGKTLTTNVSGNAITLTEGSNLSMTNGTLTGNGANGIVTQGADATLNNVTVSGYGVGLRAMDNSAAGRDSTVHVIGSNITGSTCGVLAYGNGPQTEQTTKVIIERSTVSSDNIAVCGNGTVGAAGNWGTDIQIINSQILGNETKVSTGIYHPQAEGTLNIVDSTVKAHTALIVKGGTVTIANSQIIGVGENGEEPSYGVSGAASTGDAVYIEDGYQYKIYLEVDANSTLTSYYQKGLRTYMEGSAYITVIDNGATIQDATPPTN